MQITDQFKPIPLGKVLELSSESVPDKTVLVANSRRVDYKTLNKESESLAASLSDLGFKKGDRVTIYMKNSIEFIIAFYASQKLWLIVAWINPAYQKKGIRVYPQ